MPYSDEPTSVIEDLDPEPPLRHGGRQIWEVVLGLALLAAVLGFAGWQWLRQDAQQRDYLAGTQAATRQDWEEAQALFTSASGYRDADQQAQAAATMVAKRNDAYNIALSTRNAGNWAACLDSIRQVEAIQHSYKDSDQIETQATGQVYRDAVSGTVALRLDATPPGLYYYGENGWTWLPQSDAYSQVPSGGSGSFSNHWLAYDVPGDGWMPGPTPTPSYDATGGSPQLQGRRVMAVQLPDLSHPVIFSDEPIFYNRFQFGTDGVWAIHDDAPSNLSAVDRFPVRTGLPGAFGLENSTATYQSYDRRVTATIHMDASTGQTMIMDLDPNGGRYLVATWSGQNVWGDVIGSTVTNLYLASASGDRQLLYSIKGGSFMSAQFSPDGVHALLKTYTPVELETEKQSLILLSLDGTSAPRAIDEVTAYFGSTASTFYWLNASFIDGGPYTGDIVIVEYDTNHYSISLVDPLRFTPLMGLEVPASPFLGWSIRQGRNGEALLIGQDLTCCYDPANQGPESITFVVLSPGTAPKVTTLHIDANSYLGSATIVGDRLVFTTFRYDYVGIGGITRSIFSFPASRFGAQGERPSALFSRTEAPGTDGPLGYGYDGSQNLGPTLFAYISNGDLHVSPYDGLVDILLEHRVTNLYDSSSRYSYPFSDLLH
jgi:hypothetical protein